ncbi:MAG TPA: phosphatidate cytidylyltransferase [Streptosporangiaceae bacterium]|nr:phosphatidate cytidylyltransferase [Streptosporangiaceae bacterium]
MDLHEPGPSPDVDPSPADHSSPASHAPEPPSGPNPEPPSGPAQDGGEADSPKATSRTGRNLPVAFGVSLLLGAFAILTLFTVKSTFLIMMGAAVAIGVWELDRALRPRDVRLPLIPLYVGGTALWTCAYWLGYRPAFAALGLTIVALFGWRLHGAAEGYLRDVTAAMFAFAWLPVAGGFVALMLSQIDGAHRVFLFIVVTICSDIGGYFAGILFGKHLLAPAISPKKTWEGLAGSVLACLAAGGVLLPVLLRHGHAWQGLLLGAAVVAVATMGDMVESMIKRDLGIKDMGSLLPGHGGVLDRIDAMLLTAPVTWALLTAFLPH